MLRARNTGRKKYRSEVHKDWKISCTGYKKVIEELSSQVVKK